MKREVIALPKDPREVAAAIENAMTPNGGWTKAQLAEWGVEWPPSAGWKKRLIHEARRAQDPSLPPLSEDRERIEVYRAMVRTVPCPQCGVGVDEKCRGRRGSRLSNHQERLDAYRSQRG